MGAYGVGVFAEAGDDDLDRAERQRLVELERLVAGREPYRSSGPHPAPGGPAWGISSDLPGDRL